MVLKEGGDGSNWVQNFTLVSTLAFGSGGLIGARRLSERNRWETENFKLDALDKRAALAERGIHTDSEVAASVADQDVTRSPQFLAVNIQSLVVRFIILFLMLSFWGVLVTLGLGFVEWFYKGFSPKEVYGVYGDFLYEYLGDVGRLIILGVLGGPLLADLMTSHHLRPRDLMRRHRTSGS
jgi:hypothetical protein